MVIGGGFSGVKTAGALADSLRDVAAYYPRVARSEVKVTLLQDIERLLPELSERFPGDGRTSSSFEQEQPIRSRGCTSFGCAGPG